jgi:hypothetical protein
LKKYPLKPPKRRDDVKMLTKEMERRLMIFGDDENDWNYTNQTGLDDPENDYSDDDYNN